MGSCNQNLPIQWPISDSEFEYVPVSETEVCCSTGILMDLDGGRRRERERERVCVRVCAHVPT